MAPATNSLRVGDMLRRRPDDGGALLEDHVDRDAERGETGEVLLGLCGVTLPY